MLKAISYSAMMYICNKLAAHVPSHGFRLFFYRTLMRYKIGEQSVILLGATFDARNGLTIGRHTVINQNVRIDTRGGVHIGSNVSISADVCILTADHDPQSPTFESRERAVHIDNYVFIGTRAMILPGVSIGECAVIAAGSIVSRDVPAHAIVAGIPAKKIGERNISPIYTLCYRRKFH